MQRERERTLVSVLFGGPLTILILVGGIGGRGGIKMASASTPSANEPTKDVILVHTIQLKPMTKAQISGRMISSGISDGAFASIYSVFIGSQKLTSATKLRPEK